MIRILVLVAAILGLGVPALADWPVHVPPVNAPVQAPDTQLPR